MAVHDGMELTIIIAVIGVVLSILTYFAGVKRNSNTDVEKRARFEGEIKATLKNLTESVNRLQEKFDKFSDGFYDEIDKRIAEHVRTYHEDKRL